MNKKMKACPLCGGSGDIDCPYCDGEGYDDEGFECDCCDGEGVIDCPRCEGTGVIESS